MLTRRDWIASSLTAFTPAAQKPNVLIFLSDQESAILPGPVKLPNRQRLIQSGAVQFESAFCNTPQCSPARAAILTGLDPHKAGVLTNVDGNSLGKGLSPPVPNLAKVFLAAGYRTGYFGKWHLGGDNKLQDYGFEHSSLNGQDEESATAAASWIKSQNRPWFAIVSVLDPHHIYSIPALVDQIQPREGVRKPHSNLENLKGKPPEQQQFVDKDQGRQTRNFTPDQWVRYRSYYCQLVEKADQCLGTVLNGIPQIKDTIILVSTDHGDQLGEHGLPYKGPFMYEELIHIPLLLSGPGASSLQRHAKEMVTQTDIAPTLASLAGIKWTAPTSGIDLTKPSKPRNAVFLEYYAKQQWVNPIRTIRTRRYKLNWYDRGAKELYDLETDPHELRNLADSPENAKLQSDLENRLTAWRAPLLG